MIILDDILNSLNNGDLSCITPDTVQLINREAIRIIQADSTLSMTADDIDRLNKIITISNLLYNNTTLDMLPLDDGIYDMLIIIVKKYNPNYQVGAKPVSFKDSMRTAENNLIDPFMVRDKSLQNNLYGNDFLYTWRYDARLPLDDHRQLSKRLRDTAHNYPELVGTLDKCKFVLSQDAIERGMFNASNVEILQRDFFEKHISMGLYNPNTRITVIAELKYDGISIEADVSNKVLGARSRGDTNNDEASDYTPVLYGYEFPNSPIKDEEAIGMKFEALLTNDVLRDLNFKYGKAYKNARNAVQGLIGAKDGYRWRDFITLVPLATSVARSMNMNRAEEIEFLNTYYFNRQDKLLYQIMQGDYITVLYQIKTFMKAAEAARNSMSFLYDGIVISYMDPYIINALGRQNSVNKWQMAVKFEAMRKETVFLGYQYTIGQNGVITPMIYYKPIEFYGCIHNHSSGHSYARFQELGLRYGDIITVEYVNDVMPYVIAKADCPENANNHNPVIAFPSTCPFCGAPIYFTEKSASCSNPNCVERHVGRVTNMLAKLNFKGFSEATVRKLGLKSFIDLATIPSSLVITTLKDKTAENFEAQRTKLLNSNIYDYKLVGSLGFSDIAETTWQLILARIALPDIINLPDSMLFNKLINIKGIGENTAQIIVTERSEYRDDLIFIQNMRHLITSYGAEAKTQIRFTGCRDRKLMEFLASNGYDCREGGVTKNTKILIIPYEGFRSSKTEAAASCCKQIPIDEFRMDPLGIASRLAEAYYPIDKLS